MRTSLKTTQDSSLRHASETGKPQQDSSPSTAKNGAPHHPRKVPNVTFWSPKRRSYTAKATTKRRWEQAAKQASKPRKIALGGMHPKQGNPSRIQAQGVAKTERHTTHEKCNDQEKMRTSPKISLKTTQDSSRRHASETGKPQQDSSPRGGKNAAPHHPRKVPNVTFWSPKRRSYTAKATTKRRWEQAAKQASKPRKIALGGMRPKQGNPSRIQAQGVAKTQRHTTEALKERVTPPRQRPGEDEKKPQNKPQNHAR